MTLNFTVFVDKVLDGTKRQTIRKLRKGKRQIRQGDKLTLYTGQRTPGCMLLRETVCTGVSEIAIWGDGEDYRVFVDGKQLFAAEVEALAKADGFSNACNFLTFFNEKYGRPFTGVIIKWKD